MKTLLTLLILCMSSVVSFAQSILSISSTEGRRNTYIWVEVFSKNTQFMAATSLEFTFESAGDAFVFTMTDVVVYNNTYCAGLVKIPATATPGMYDVGITTILDGTIVLRDAFMVLADPPAPEIISISPTMAGKGDYVAMTVSAQYAHFLSSPAVYGYIAGNYNYIMIDSMVVIDDTTLNIFFAIPANANSDTCSVSITTNTDGLFLQSAFIIQGLSPGILSVSPNSGTHGTHVDLTVNTTGTAFTMASNTGVFLVRDDVFVGPTSLAVTNDTLLIASFDIPQRIHSGVFDVALYTNGITMLEQGAFTITGINPVLTGVSPTQSIQGQTVDITVSGTEMYFTAGSVIEFGLYDSSGYYIPITLTTKVVLNDNQFKATVVFPKYAPTGLYTVFVVIDGDTSELQNVFTVTEDGIQDPTIISVSPNTTQRGQLVDVTITASGSSFTQTSNIEVYLAGFGYNFGALAVTVLNDIQLKCTFYLPSYAVRESYSVVVVEDNTSIPLVVEGAFTITGNPETDPILVSMSSTTAYPGQQFGVTITGANTHFLSPDVEIIFYSDSGLEWTPTNFVATSNTSITAQFHFSNNFPPGIYHLKIFSSGDGYLVLKDALMVNDGTVGLDEESGLIGKLYPNPVRDKLYIETLRTVNHCSIIDITGKQTVVNPKEFKQDNTHLIIPIDKLGLSKGIYFIRLDSDDGFAYRRFVVE